MTGIDSHLRLGEMHPQLWKALGKWEKLKTIRLKLSKREFEVATLLVEGITKEEIANSMACSPETVRTHRINLYRKLEINNMAELCLLFNLGSPE